MSQLKDTVKKLVKDVEALTKRVAELEEQLDLDDDDEDGGG